MIATGEACARGSGRRNDRRVGERGSAVLELPLLLGFVLVPFALLVLTLPTWVEHRAIANDSAAEVARAIAIDGSSERSAGLLADFETVNGLDPGALRWTPERQLVAGAPISTSVEVDIPLLVVPVFGPVGGFTWTATHTERLPDHGVVFDRAGS